MRREAVHESGWAVFPKDFSDTPGEARWGARGEHSGHINPGTDAGRPGGKLVRKHNARLIHGSDAPGVPSLASFVRRRRMIIF